MFVYLLAQINSSALNNSIISGQMTSLHHHILNTKKASERILLRQKTYNNFLNHS